MLRSRLRPASVSDAISSRRAISTLSNRPIDDTIRVLNTGIWQTREGVEIHRLPSLHHIRDAASAAPWN